MRGVSERTSRRLSRFSKPGKSVTNALSQTRFPEITSGHVILTRYIFPATSCLFPAITCLFHVTTRLFPATTDRFPATTYQYPPTIQLHAATICRQHVTTCGLKRTKEQWKITTERRKERMLWEPAPTRRSPAPFRCNAIRFCWKEEQKGGFPEHAA